MEAGTGGLSLSVDHAPCVRLFHSGGDAGCRTPTREGVTGPLLLVDSERALKDIEVGRQNRTYCLRLPTSLSLVLRVKELGDVAAMLVMLERLLLLMVCSVLMPVLLLILVVVSISCIVLGPFPTPLSRSCDEAEYR